MSPTSGTVAPSPTEHSTEHSFADLGATPTTLTSLARVGIEHPSPSRPSACRSRWPGSTSSARRAPAPARRWPSASRSSRRSSRTCPRCRPWSSSPPGSSASRSPATSTPPAVTPRARSRSSAGARSAPRSSPSTRAPRSWWARPAGSSTTCARATSSSTSFASWSWTRPTRCSTWASCPTSRRSSPPLPSTARRCCSRPPCPRRWSRSPAATPGGRPSSTPSPRASRPPCPPPGSSSSRCTPQPLPGALPHPGRSRPRPGGRVPAHQARGRPHHQGPGRRGLPGRRPARGHAPGGPREGHALLPQGQAGRAGLHRRGLEGLDIAGLSHVINYDTPEDDRAYVHRIGRTGRPAPPGSR